MGKCHTECVTLKPLKSLMCFFRVFYGMLLSTDGGPE